MLWRNFYFRLFPRTILSTQIIESLSHLLHQIPGKLLSHHAHQTLRRMRKQPALVIAFWQPAGLFLM